MASLGVRWCRKLLFETARCRVARPDVLQRLGLLKLLRFQLTGLELRSDELAQGFAICIRRGWKSDQSRKRFYAPAFLHIATLGTPLGQPQRPAAARSANQITSPTGRICDAGSVLSPDRMRSRISRLPSPQTRKTATALELSAG